MPVGLFVLFFQFRTARPLEGKSGCICRCLCKELEFIAQKSENKKLNTIYIGGGTPTTLTADQLERLMSWIDEKFSREHLLEYTVEAGRPDSITEEKLKVMKRHDITRISINPQSMQQKTLDAIGRRHSVEEIKRGLCTGQTDRIR